MAEPIDVWVLGSYNEFENAEGERIRLSEVLGAAVEITSDTGIHRVIVAASAISEEEVQTAMPGAWLMPNRKPAAAVEPAPESEQKPEIAKPAPRQIELKPSAAPADVEALPVENVWPALYPPLHANESLPEYCIRLPESPLCTDPRSARILERASKLMQLRERADNACERISQPERRQKCLDLHIDEDS